MKKIFTTAVLGLFLLAGTATAAAQSLNGGEITLDYTYNVAAGSGYYTAPSNGVFTIIYPYYNGNNLYDSTSYDKEVDGNGGGYISDDEYAWSYNLTDGQTVYFYLQGFDSMAIKFTFQSNSGGSSTPSYEIVSMTPASGNMVKPTSDETMPVFVVTLNDDFNYTSGRQPYWQLYNVTTSSVTLASRDFTSDSTVDKQFTTKPLDYEIYGDYFVVGNTYKFQMSLDNSTMLDGNEWTIVSDATTDPTPEPGDDVDAEEIEVGKEFTIDSDSPLWVYTPTVDVPNFYFEIGPFEYDVFEESFMDYLAFSTSPDGSDPISLEYNAISDGGIYTGTNLVANTPYYLVVLNDTYNNAYYTATLYTQEYVAPSVEYVFVEIPFTVSSTQTAYKFNSLNEGEYYLTSNSNVNILENGTLKINTYGWNIFNEDDCTAVEGPDGVWYYSGLTFQSDEVYDIEYTGSETIELTIVAGTYGSKYMSTYADVFDNEFATDDYYSAVMLSWGEAVELVDQDLDDIIIPVYKDVDPIGFLTAQHLQFAGMAGGDEPGVGPLAETGDMGMQLLILTGASELFFEAGTYTIYFPAGVVKNADGEINLQQEITVTVSAVASPVAISPETGAIFAVGENVEFAITFADEVVADNDAAWVVFVYNSNDYDSEDYFEAFYTWTDTTVIAVDEDTMVITLGEELPEGNYVLTVAENVLTVDGAANAPIEIMFEVTDDSEGVNTIGAALEGNEAIYNLQGVKVDANKLSKGIYIINGKKVLVK